LNSADFKSGVQRDNIRTGHRQTIRPSGDAPGLRRRFDTPVPRRPRHAGQNALMNARMHL
jgi:hypothetical protein